MASGHQNPIKVKDAQTGEEIDAVVVKVVKAEEPFSYLTLEDGTEVTVRNTVIRVVRLLNKWNQSGEPRYDFTFTANISTNAPQALRKNGKHDA